MCRIGASTGGGLRGAVFFAAATERPAGRATGFLAATFFTAVFLATVFFATDFFATGFRAAGVLAAAFFAAIFFAGAFCTAALRGAVFFAAVFAAGSFPAVAFSAADFFATDLRVVVMRSFSCGGQWNRNQYARPRSDGHYATQGTFIIGNWDASVH